MKDIKLYLEKLRSDAEDCLTISETAANKTKRDIFKMLAATYHGLAVDLEKIIDLNLIADGEREKRLMGILSGDDGPEHLAETAKLLRQHGAVNDTRR
ncbi:hypothetical protein V4R08_15120 [Nitrobacter sp. NHB1]|uniref:hypothetical protein n=1 Tax=Nitrobacter sp. NHB1 TaxID=3119830 RepID=UPI002FFFE69B